MPESTGGSPEGAATQAKETARETAQEAASTVQEKAREQIDQRTNQAGEQAGSLAGDLRQISEQLREQGNDTPARIGEQAADRAERLGGYLSESGPDKILRDVEDFGRRQPWLALAGGVALGIVAARFLKASSSERYSQSRQNGSGGAPQIERQPMPPPVGNLSESTPVAYGTTETARAAARDFSDPAVR